MFHAVPCLPTLQEAGENNNLNLLNVLPTGLLAVIRLIIARAFGGSVQDVVQYDNYADVIKMYKLTDKGVSAGPHAACCG